MKKSVLWSLVVACCALDAGAATWTVYTNSVDGMTGPQQITNALTQLASGDTILVKPGTYDFTGISMRTDNFTKDGVTYVITNHLTRNINFTLKGDTSGHWDDSVVFTGDGRCCDLKNYKKYCNFYNITFDGFDCNRYPSSGSFESRGGALRLEDNSTYDIVSNCVIRNCSAFIGGAAGRDGVPPPSAVQMVALHGRGATCCARKGGRSKLRPSREGRAPARPRRRSIWGAAILAAGG